MDSAGKSVSSVKSLGSDYSFMDFEANRHEHPLERKLKLAILYFESQYTTKFAFLAQVATNKTLINSKVAIPNLGDTAFMMDIVLTSGITVSSEIVDNFKSLIFKSKSDTGTWNYFQGDNKMIPDDIETSAHVVSALHACKINLKKNKKYASKIYEQAVVHKDGFVDVYFRKRPTEHQNADPSSVILKKWCENRRVDISATANFLHMLNRVGIEHHRKFSKCYDFLSVAVNALLENRDDHPYLCLYDKSYNDVDVMCFFISRLVSVSTYAKEMFQTRLSRVVTKRLSVSSSSPISLSCRILAAINIGVVEDQKDFDTFATLAKNLMTLQNDDFSFPKVGFYHAHKKEYYFGSSALSTALAISAITSLLQLFGSPESVFQTLWNLNKTLVAK